jgi:hypothetical protein
VGISLDLYYQQFKAAFEEEHLSAMTMSVPEAFLGVA